MQIDRRLFATSVFATVAAGTFLNGRRASAVDRRTLALGTSPAGGGFSQYGEAFAATLNEAATAFTIQATNTKGSLENVPLLEANKLALGLVGGEAAFEALTGLGRAPAPLKVVAAMYSSAGMFAAPGNSAVRTIDDLRGKPVVFGASGSSLVVQARYVLDGMGLDMDKDFQAITLPRASEGLAMLADGRAAAIWGGGVGWPGFVELAKSPGGARFITPDANESARILAKHSFLKPLTVPADTYVGQKEPIASVGSWSVILANAGLDEAIAHDLIAAIDKRGADFARRLPAGRETTAGNVPIAAPKPEFIHPGVLRYLREAGLQPKQ